MSYKKLNCQEFATFNLAGADGTLSSPIDVGNAFIGSVQASWVGGVSSGSFVDPAKVIVQVSNDGKYFFDSETEVTVNAATGTSYADIIMPDQTIPGISCLFIKFKYDKGDVTAGTVNITLIVKAPTVGF